MGTVKFNHAKIMKMYHDMKSCSEIARTLGVSHESVRRHFVRNGLPTDRYTRVRNQIIRMASDGHAYSQIAKTMRCGIPTVKKAIANAYPNGKPRTVRKQRDATDTETPSPESGFDFRPHNLRFKQA